MSSVIGTCPSAGCLDHLRVFINLLQHLGIGQLGMVDSRDPRLCSLLGFLLGDGFLALCLRHHLVTKFPMQVSIAGAVSDGRG